MIGIKACKAVHLTNVREADCIFQGDNSGDKRSQDAVTVIELRTSIS